MTVQTPPCDCRRGYRPNGQLAWVLHASVDCPGNVPPPPPPPRRKLDTLDTLAALRRALRGLKQDLADAENHLTAPSRRDWPAGCDVLPAELTIGEQLGLLHDRARYLADHGNFAAEPLRRRVRKVLLEAAGFTAPATVQVEQSVAVPPAIQAALERLAPRTPTGVALATPQVGDTPETARDRWRVRLWVAELEA